MDIVLYSTHCPRCNVLAKKLNAKNVIFTEIDNEDEILKEGFDAVPVLVVDGKVMQFKEATEWVNNQGNE